MRRTVTGCSIWLRELDGSWGGNHRELGENRGKSSLSNNFAKIMWNSRSNLGLNLARKSKFPNMDDIITDVTNDEILNEERSIMVVEWKKTPRLDVDECGSSEHELKVVSKSRKV